jgi:hypothetical protein
MEALLNPCITVLLNRPGSTFFDLLRFMYQQTNTDLWEQGKKASNPAHVHFFCHLFNSEAFRATRASI